MYMEKVMDAGNIISKEIPITAKDDTGTLFEN